MTQIINYVWAITWSIALIVIGVFFVRLFIKLYKLISKKLKEDNNHLPFLLLVSLFVMASCQDNSEVQLAFDENLEYKKELIKDLGFNLDNVIIYDDNTYNGELLEFKTREDAVKYFKDIRASFDSIKLKGQTELVDRQTWLSPSQTRSSSDPIYAESGFYSGVDSWGLVSYGANMYWSAAYKLTPTASGVPFKSYLRCTVDNVTTHMTGFTLLQSYTQEGWGQINQGIYFAFWEAVGTHKYNLLVEDLLTLFSVRVEFCGSVDCASKVAGFSGNAVF